MLDRPATMQETNWTELGCENVHLMSSGTASAIVLRCRAPSRSGYTVKLMKFKLQGPSLAQTPSKALRGALALYSHSHFFFNFQKQHILSASCLVLQRGIRQMLNKSIVIFMDFVMYVVFVSFFKYAVR